MALVDANQDPACMASNACLKLIQKNNLQPEDIGRIYMLPSQDLMSPRQ